MTSIRKTVFSGVMYTGIAKYSNVIFTILIGAVLARLLSPEEFGIVAIVTVFVTFFYLLSDIGIGPAIVQSNSLADEDIRSVFSVTILIGLIFSGLFFFSAHLIAGFYEDPNLVEVSRWLSLAILFHSFQIVPKALVQKNLKFKSLGIVTVSSQLLGGVIAIILAYHGYSYYSLVFRSIFNGLFMFIGFLLVSPVLPVLKIKWAPIRAITRFASFQFLFSIINYFSRNLDNLLIGKYFGQASLGFYDKAYRLMLLPVSNLTHVITPVLFPVFSKQQHDLKAIAKSYRKVFKLLSLVGFPLSVFLFSVSEELIFIIYGGQWGASIPVFRVLALTVGIQIVLSSSGSVFQAIGRTDLLFYSGLLSATVVVSAILIGIFVGGDLESIGWALLIAYSLNFFQAYWILIKKGLNDSLASFLIILKYPMFISLSIHSGLWMIRYTYIENLFVSLILKFGIALLIFISLNLLNASNRELIFINYRKLLGRYRKKEPK